MAGEGRKRRKKVSEGIQREAAGVRGWEGDGGERGQAAVAEEADGGGCGEDQPHGEAAPGWVWSIAKRGSSLPKEAGDAEEHG